ncbi:E3 ubiquitin-protein ligase rnf213-alpha-like [Mytilus edulis]|uniref:E3 ubiquitin-protein ligase rnf213-alpha-like n=1 Tax=Mytilus edulis TaxID=6550 RepID=UPI0039F02CC3
MKCKNNVDGGICGEEIPQSSKFCLACGGKVAKEDDTTTKACPQCSSLITKRQKFCSGCGWRIDPAIFLAPKILCAGKDDDGNTCGAELIPGVKFCPECGSDQVKLNEQDKVAKGESESIPVERLTEVSSRVDDLTNTRRSPQQSSGSGSSSRSDSPDAWKPPGMLSSTPDSTEETTVDSEMQRVAGSPQREPGIIEQNDEGQGDVVGNEENTKKTESQPPANAINEPSKSPVNSLDKIHQQSEAMETDETQIEENATPKSDNTMEDNAMNAESTQPECPPLGPSLSEAGNLVTSYEPMEIPVTETGLTETDTNKTEEPVATLPVNEEIPPHSFVANSTGNAGAKNKVHQLAQTFEKNVNVRSPEKVKTQAAGPEQEQNQDVRNGNIPPESVGSGNGDETGDNKPPASEDNNTTDNQDWKNAPLPESSSSENDEDEEDDEEEEEKEGVKPDPSVKSKGQKKKAKKRRKKEEEKKKDRKKRKEEKNKTETDGASDVSKKQERKEKKARLQTDPSAEKVEGMDQLPSNEETRPHDKDDKNRSNNATASGSGEPPSNTGNQASGSSYADAVSTNLRSKEKNKQFAEVHFHCIVSPSLWSNLERDKLYLTFQDSTLGGWQSRKHLMKGERTLPDSYVVYSGMVNVPKTILHKKLFYNYIMVHGKGITDTFEYVYSGTLSGGSMYRCLDIKNSDLVKGVYHRYDGVVREHPSKYKGAWQSFKELIGIDDYKKVLFKDAELSGKSFKPAWQLTSYSSDGINGEELINHISLVVDGLKEVYCRHASLWYPLDFHKVVGSVILHPDIIVLLKILNTKENITNEEQVLHMVTAITISYLVSEYQIVLDDSARSMLCESLLPKPDNEKKLSCDFDTVSAFFPTTKKQVTESVLTLSRQIASKTSNPCWTYCLPILHFLQGKCAPFQQASAAVNHGDTKPEWWGISEYIYDIEYFKAKTLPWDRSSTLVLKKLIPYFQMDFYLPRSFMAALKLEEIPNLIASGIFPSDCILAVLFFFIKSSTSYQKEKIEANLKMLFNQAIVQNFSDDPKEITFADAWRSCRISGDVLQETLKYMMNRDFAVFAIEAFVVSLDMYDKVQEKVDWKSKEIKDIKVSQDSHMKMFERMRFDICKYLSNQTFYTKELAYLERWNAALRIKAPKGNIKDSYMKYVEEQLKMELQKVSASQALIKIYLIQNEQFESTIQAMLSEIAFKAIHEFDFDMEIMREDRVVMRMGDLINSVLERSWEKTQSTDPHQILEHAVTWASFPTFIEMYYKFSKHLKEDSLHLLNRSIKVLNGAIVQLFQGEIMVKDIQIILEKRTNFQKTIQSLKDVNVKATMMTLNLREKELQAYTDTLKIVKEFLSYCIYCKANTTVMEDLIRKLDDLGTFPINRLVRTLQFDEITDIERHRPFVKVFELSQDQLDILPDIVECSRGLLFTKLWEDQGIELKKELNRKLTIHEVLTEVWEPTVNQWKTICQRLKRGDLFFSEFERFFRNTEIGNLRDELTLLERGGNTRWVDERLDQVEKYRNLKSCEFGAEAILEVVKAFDLQGDFNQIITICKFTKGADTNMNKLDKSLLKTCSVLREVTKERAECLKTFIRCKQLVDWLRESMPSGLKELKVFVDLASISAGEGDMEIDKVNCLHSATTGYAPLIFNLEKDCNTKIFLNKCQEVWKELLANPELPRKLIDTNRQLAWLQTVKRSHGSVEVSSLQQAEAINTKGIYQVGNLKKIENLRKTNLNEVLELRVAEDDQEGRVAQRKLYRYDQLHDLQSRLMLVAGKAEKGKDEVDRFMEILDGAVRLGNIYAKLVEEGCVLFSQWHVKFLCDRGRLACAFIYFGYGEDRHTLKGRVDESSQDVSAIIPKIAKFLEQCHENWLRYIDEKREKYYCLNFFTIDQMVILQQELVKIGSNQEPSALIYPLLSAVKQGCTREDLVKAMSAAKEDVEQMDRQRQEEEETKESDEEVMVEVEEPDEVKTSKFLQEMITAGYNMKLAKEALKNVGPDDVDGGIVWCMDNEDDFQAMDVDEPGRQSPGLLEEQAFSRFTGWTQSGQSLASVTGSLVDHLGIGAGENNVEILIKALESLWDTFLTSISSSVSDYLSVEHLGMILNRLTEQETFEVDRSYLPCFNMGEPNLIICRQRDIYNTVISVYSHEDDRPLPQSDEVLLCTPQTTLDMLEIFWRRSLFADDSKVYCLVNADLLDYEVSDKGEKSLERHMKQADSKGRNYRLVVICSSENEDRSRIVAALDKYRRPQLPTDGATIRKYLLTKLKIDRSSTGIRPASAVDFERCGVRVVKSWRAGVGKSLYKKRMVTDLYKLITNITRRKASNVTIPLHEKTINVDDIMDILLEETLAPRCHEPRIFHIDISHVVQEGVDAFLFQLLVLGCLGHSTGNVWRRSELDYYIIESMPLLARDMDVQGGKLRCLHHCLDILPHVTCRSPQESFEILSNIRRPADYTDHDRLFDGIEFKSPTFQRPYQYLKRLDTNCRLDDVNAQIPDGDKKQCLNTLLKHCGIRDPSWSELYHFVSFLNKQLQDFEVSAFCSLAAGEDLPGFAKFVLRFLIQMSRDFSTRSLIMSEESPLQLLQRQMSEEDQDKEGEDVIQLYQMRRTWETSPHPYLFFNPDQNSMTFLGFNIDRRTGNLVDVQTNTILEPGIMENNLFDALVRNKVNLAENFDALPRLEKITKLCNVMGLDIIHDPDETYELTTDNVKKILAIYMRFRCDIPVIIMGETGCGKTRLIKFMCKLQQPPGVNVENMILMKVHGGTKASDIIKKVRKAEEIARLNAAEFVNTDYRNMDTVLFFDEANTTEAIGVIKEIMCDKTLGGKPIKLHEKLKIVAACNPYRKHSDDLIKRLEQAGLGYHVSARETSDKLGHVPMRHLVYRVQSLPQSMLPLVWDFGQLNTTVEEMYIRQMVLRYIKNGQLPTMQGLDTTVSKILTVSQDFMREQKDECSFVSLRDVERVLQVMSWFYSQSQDDEALFQRMRDESEDSETESEEESMELGHVQHMDDVTRSLVLALGVCYHACLKNREEYRETVATYFTQPLRLVGGADGIEEEISRCQAVFLDSVELAPNIARNQALKENVFMMIVCIELRIPMFLVGKPGSSKSLAKTIVADAMQGNAAHNDLFKSYKQVQMVSFQCSPLSVPEGIVGTFRQCAAYQKDKNLDRFVSIVVLDEIGLAEDSPRMPLKTLHPLLEDGCPDDEEPEKYKKVAFIGISNWALDPAKMNRGILVQREVPDVKELTESAEGICSTSKKVLKLIRPMIPLMADSYLDLFKEASTKMREFFGLRDFYSLLKMLYAFVSASRKKPTWPQLEHCILRNFGGLEDVKPVEIFYNSLSHLVDKTEQKREEDPDCTSSGMIQACLTGDKGDNKSNSESRYLLLLTENYGALTVLQQKIFTMDNAVVIFGSSFPSDQEYTQVCRNINRIKVCMETGSTVILLNLENLYESLYDALNQYYVLFGGERYVDLGLGSHRVKCRVHKTFRLIVVAEKQIVYDKFPIPLINRLEKHFLSLKNMLTPAQLELADKLQAWAQHFCEVKVPAYMRNMRDKKDIRKIGDAFMGYHADTCAAIILHVCQEKRCNDEAISQIEDEILREAQSILLWCATPAAVFQLGDKHGEIFKTYFLEQHHESLADYLQYKIVQQQKHNIHVQITTNSKLLATADIEVLCRFIPILKQNITLLTLQSFDTEQQFSRKIKSFFDHTTTSDSLLIVQCDCGDQNADLIACARYTVQGELQQVREERQYAIHVVFLIQLPGIAGGCFTGFQCGLWHSVHIDDIHPAPEDIPSVADMHGTSVSALLASTKTRPEDDMEVEEGINEQMMDRMETNEDEVDLMDIQLEVKTNEKGQKFKRHFKIDNLIMKCLQPALGNVKDPMSDSSRAIDRLKIIHNCLKHEAGEVTVMSGIAKHLSSILREKEESFGAVITNWLSTEASRPENINRAGTFRKFAVQCLESKVIPILAGIIAFIDTNRNMDILTNNPTDSWHIHMWVDIFNNPELTQLKYSWIVSPTRQHELQEVAVKTTSKDGKPFPAVMPFSWLIFGQIEDILRKSIETKESTESHFDVVVKASEIFQSLPLGKLLSDVEGTYILEVLKCYIRDFVYMIHPVQTNSECQLLCESVITGCRHLVRGEYGRLLPSLLGCHMTYILNDMRFKNFANIVHIWPGCSQRILDFQQESSNFYLVTDEEKTLDILALHLLVNNLEPNKEALNKPEPRTKWLRQVCDYRPVVERIFGHFSHDIENKEFQYGERCQKGIENARYQWTRAVVVKLFIEHVCTAGKEEVEIRRCMPLWVTLRDGANMKEVQSLEKVEKFIKTCNKDVVTQCFGQQVTCVGCENPIQGAPVRLPCEHVICRKCFQDCILLKDFVCPNCQKEFPKDLDPNKAQKSGEVRKYQDYRRRCNSFFMEVVSQLCFAEGTPPSQEVIEKLLSYIIGHVGKKKVERVVSKELTIFDDSIDPTPVVRSFLLQQLMQTSGNEIEKNLSRYFNHASELVRTTGDPHHLIELCQLILQCMEDSLHQQYVNREDEVAMVTKMLREALPNISPQEVQTIDKIDHISKVRFCLTVVAKYIYNLFGTGQKNRLEPDIRRLFDAAARLCEECGSPWPRRYFVKQLCRCYGIDSYQTVLAKSDASFLRWVRLPELKEKKVEECHDRYIVTGDEYKELRETIVTTVLNEDAEKLQQLLQRPKEEWQTRIKLLLALHREISMNNVYGGQPQKFTDKGKEFLGEFIMNHDLIRHKEFPQRILQNAIWRLPGNIVPRMPLAEQNISCLLAHCFVLITEIPGKHTLLTPLINIARKPQKMVSSYLPTMPQDELLEIKEAVLAARRGNVNENPVFYRCPNGHPYIIGNCGNPAYVGVCKECGREIGGQGYNLRPGNELDAGVDRTEKGHVLGPAARLGPLRAPERKLNRASCAVLRLLTHMSMYIGANVNEQAACQTIKPTIQQGDVPMFILEHIDLDLTSIQNILGKNRDEILALIHFLLAQIMNSHTLAVIGEDYPAKVRGLKDKDSRTQWEDDFAKRYIMPILQDMENILKKCNDGILQDQRLGADPLLQILYETDRPQEATDIVMLHDIPAVWRYRAMITVNHLRQNLDTTKQKLPVLRLFLKEEHHLRAVRFVPSIIRLQKMLIQKYSRKLDRAEATTLTISDVRLQMRQERRLKEFNHLLEDFTKAWNCVRESLETYACPANESIVTVDKSHCRTDITEKTAISHLIPTYRDAGLCSYVLLFFLLKKQNLFLQEYCARFKIKEESLPKVYVRDISAAHLVSYHPDRDLLPMVLANCNYSFEVGQGTKVEYNFTNLERQLMDRFLFSKSIINNINEIETITYRSESTNAVVFKSLCLRVKQERLNPAVQSQICGELRLKSFPDLCESMDKLDIAISFLKSVGSDPESSLSDFMTNTLKIDNPFPSPKAHQASRCKNTMSLWITFAMERAKCLAKYDKKAFEGISENFKNALTEENINNIEDILNKLPLEQIDVLVELLFECIVLKIDVPQNMDDEDYVDMSKICLRDTLIGYLDACPYEEEDLTIDDTLMTAIGQLPSDKEDPNRILTAQSIEVWSLVNKVFTSKQRQRR